MLQKIFIFIFFDIFYRKIIWTTLTMILTIAVATIVYFCSIAVGNGIVIRLYKDVHQESNGNNVRDVKSSIRTIRVIPSNKEEQTVFKPEQLSKLKTLFPHSEISPYTSRGIVVRNQNLNDTYLFTACCFAENTPHFKSIPMLFTREKKGIASIIIGSHVLEDQRIFPAEKFPQFRNLEEKIKNLSFEQKNSEAIWEQIQLPKYLYVDLKGKGRTGFGDGRHIPIPITGIFKSPELDYKTYDVLIPEDFFRYIEINNSQWYYIYQLGLAEEPWVITQFSFENIGNLESKEEILSILKHNFNFKRIENNIDNITVQTGAEFFKEIENNNVILTPHQAFSTKNWHEKLPEILKEEQNKRQDAVISWKVQSIQNNDVLEVLTCKNISTDLLLKLLEAEELVQCFNVLNLEQIEKNLQPLQLKLVLKKASDIYPPIVESKSLILNYNAAFLTVSTLAEVVEAHDKILPKNGYGRVLDPSTLEAIKILIKSQNLINKAIDWISLVLILLLAFIIGSASYTHSDRKTTETGILKVFGVSSWQIITLYSLEFFTITFLGMGIGTISYLIIRPGILNIIQENFNNFELYIPIVSYIKIFIIGLAISVIASYIAIANTNKITIPDALNYDI